MLWEVGARESKRCSPGSNCILWSVLPKRSMKPSDILIVNPTFERKG